MSYTVSTNLTFTRIHICHHCGFPFEYRIKEHLSVSEALTEASGVESLKKIAATTLENKILKKPCPHCKQLQNSMIYEDIRRCAFWTFIAMLIILVVSFFKFQPHPDAGSNDPFFFYFLCNLAPAILILIPIFKIRGFFQKKPAIEFFGNNEETYQATRQYYQSLQFFMICTLPVVFIPWIGGPSALVTLLIFFFRIFLMPDYIAHQGFPIYCKDVDFHR